MNSKNIGLIGIIQTSLITGCILLSQVFLSPRFWDYRELDYIRDKNQFIFLLLQFLFEVRDCGMFLYFIPICWTLLSIYIIYGQGFSSKLLSVPLWSGITLIFVLSAVAVNIPFIFYYYPYLMSH